MKLPSFKLSNELNAFFADFGELRPRPSLADMCLKEQGIKKNPNTGYVVLSSPVTNNDRVAMLKAGYLCVDRKIIYSLLNSP